MLADKVFLLVDETVSSRILIVSENPAICTELMALMSDEGFENLTVAGNVAVALSCAESVSRSNRQHFDLAILCLDKPTEFAETIWGVRESFARYELPLVVVGEWCESDDFIEVIEAGVIDFIAYPINHYSFIARVKTLLRLRHANSKLQRHQEALHTLTAELEQKNHRLNSILEDIRSDLFVAGELQRSFLPDKQVKYESVEFAWFYQPCATIGGDLINVLPISKRHIAVFVLDVAGHGVSAALLAFAIHRYLSSSGNKSIYRRKNGMVRSPAEILAALNRDFTMENECFKYFTITFGILDTGSGVFSYCRAGQTPLLIIRRDGSHEILKDGSPPVGITLDADFAEFKATLSPGDRLVLYSDGLVEARRSEEEFFSEDRLVIAMQKLQKKRLDQAVEQFVRFFQDWMGSSIPGDDIALLALEIKKLLPRRHDARVKAG